MSTTAPVPTTAVGTATPASGRSIRTVLDATVERAAALLEGAADGRAPVSGMRWRVGEIGAHLAQSIVVFRQAVEGEVTPYGERGDFDAAIDQRLVDELPEREPARLAALVREGYSAFRQTIAHRPDDETVERFQGYSVGAICAVWVLDLNIHGSQIAGATHRSWSVANEDIRLGLETILPFIYDRAAARGLHVTYAMHIKGTAPLVYGFDDGALRMGANAGRIDCHLGVDPVAFLMVSVGVLPQWKAALTGKMRSWGRKPWLALRIPRLVPRVPHGGVA